MAINIEPPSEGDSLAEVIDAFTEAHQAGQAPTVDELCRRYPQYADVLGSLLTMIVALHKTNEACHDEDLLGDDIEGRSIGPYQLESILGKGGFGTVFSASDSRGGSQVALKVWDSRHLTSIEQSRIQREFKILSQLPSSETVPFPFVRVIDLGQQEPLTYLAMERIDGCNLRQWVTRHGPASEQDAVDIGLEIARGLEIAHSLGIIHRDIKPSNVMRTATGEIKIVDFGLALHETTSQAAKLLESDEISTVSKSLLTESGSLLGTIWYMAPEQALDPRSAGVASDIYSLGCTLYYLLVGSPPFPQTHPLPCLIAHREDEIPTIASSNRSVSPKLEGVLRKAMAKRPTDRFASMAEFRSMLAQAGGAKRANQPARLAAVVAIAATLLLLITAWRSIVFRSNIPLKNATLSPLAEDLEGRDKSLPPVNAVNERDSFIVDNEGSRYPVRWQWGTGRFMHWNYVIDVLFASEGEEVISGGWDGDIVCWNTVDGSILQRFASDSEVTDIALNHDETFLAAGYRDGTVKLWDRRTGQSRDLAVLSQSALQPTLAFSPTSNWLAIADRASPLVSIVDVSSDQTLVQFDRQIVGNSAPLAFSSDGQTIFAVGDQNSIFRWRISDQKLLTKYSPQANTIASLAVHPRDHQLATLDDKGWIHLYDFDDAEPTYFVHAHDAPGRRLIYSHGGKTLLSSGEDQFIRRWNSADLTLQSVVADRTRSNWGLAVHPETSVVASVGTDQRVLFWPSADGTSPPLGGKIWSVTFSPDSQSIAMGGADGTIGIFNLGDNPSPRWLSGHDREIAQLHFFPDDDGRIVSASRDGTVRLWDLGSGNHQVIHEHPGSAFCVALSDDGRWLASGGWDREIRVTNLRNNRSQTLYGHRHMINDLVFTDGGNLVSVGGDRMEPTSSSLAIAWQIDQGTWKELARKQFGDAIMSVDRSVDPMSIWLAGYHETPLTLWRFDKPESKTLSYPDNSIAWDLATRSDRKLIVGGDGEGRLRLWQVDKLGRPTTFKLGPDAGEVHAVAVSPNDNLIAIACGNGVVKVIEP